MANASEIVQGWLNSGRTATSPEEASAALQQGSESTVHISSASPDSDEIARAENSTVDDLLQESSEDTPPDSSETELAGSKAPQKTSAELKEVITVTDETGKRRRVEIDYTNRESIKKAHLQAAGMRKFQAERDQEKQAHTATRQALDQRNADWNQLETLYQQGPEALFDTLAGRRGAFKEHVTKELQRSKFLENASPEEIQALEAREKSDRTSRELQQIRKELEETRKQATESRETAEVRAVESQVNPVFDKYRFADKLGDADDEHMFDEKLWNSALQRLVPYEEKGLLSPELIDREFRNVAAAIRKRINVQAENKASRVIQQKKQEATENVQAKLKSGYRSNNTAQEAGNLINQGSGGLNQLLKNWGKYGSVFSGNKK